MPETLGQNSLSVEEEIAAIIEAMSASTSAKIRIVGLPASGEAGEEIIPAYKETVLEELEASCNIAHFACHGVTDHFSPLRGSFMPKKNPMIRSLICSLSERLRILSHLESLWVSTCHMPMSPIFLPVQLLSTLPSPGMKVYILRVDSSWSGFCILLGLYGRQMVMWQSK